jgi:uncharacterized protein (DUF433 family)
MLTSMTSAVTLSVRLPAAERRRVKSLAVSLGLSLQDLVHQALEAWVLQHDPQMGRRHNPQPGALGGADVDKPARRNDEGKPTRRSRKAGDRPRPGGTGAQARDLGADAWAWLRGAPRLDWSQCPAVEIASTKAGRVWVFRGTHIPLPAVLRDFMDGHPMEKILARYDGLTRDMLKSALQFAALGLAPSASPR